MRKSDIEGITGFGLGVLVGLGLRRARSGAPQPNPFRRPTIFRVATKVTVLQLADGNWDIDPYRLQLPTAGKPFTVTWVLDPRTVAAGFAFDPERGVFVQDGGDNFSNPRLNADGTFSVNAANRERDAGLHFKYGIALLKNGKLHFTIDPAVQNGSRP